MRDGLDAGHRAAPTLGPRVQEPAPAWRKDTMHCPQCQHADPAGARFCNACGAKLEVVCPACSQVNPPGSRFCNACGHNLAQPPAPAASVAAPSSYTPKHLADKILTSRSALEGERKQVTVLFADMAGFTTLASGSTPKSCTRSWTTASSSSPPRCTASRARSTSTPATG